jgi:hypothetical protein
VLKMNTQTGVEQVSKSTWQTCPQLQVCLLCLCSHNSYSKFVCTRLAATYLSEASLHVHRPAIYPCSFVIVCSLVIVQEIFLFSAAYKIYELIV